jgi:hypothetical protein
MITSVKSGLGYRATLMQHDDDYINAYLDGDGFVGHKVRLTYRHRSPLMSKLCSEHRRIASIFVHSYHRRPIKELCRYRRPPLHCSSISGTQSRKVCCRLSNIASIGMNGDPCTLREILTWTKYTVTPRILLRLSAVKWPLHILSGVRWQNFCTAPSYPVPGGHASESSLTCLYSERYYSSSNRSLKVTGGQSNLQTRRQKGTDHFLIVP